MSATLLPHHSVHMHGHPLEIAGRIHAFLPEPVPNRAEALEGIEPADWLSGIVAADGSGFTILAGGGTTFLLLYAAGQAIAASLVDRHGATSDNEAIEQLRAAGPADVFALTHVCDPLVARSLAALFGEQQTRMRLDADPRALAACLSAARGERATGALLVDDGADAWSILLLADGMIVAGYGSDDRSLKPGIDDVSILLHREQLWITRLVPSVADLSAALVNPSSAKHSQALDTDLLFLESAMIGILSQLEYTLTQADRADAGERPALVAQAFAATLAALDEITGVAPGAPVDASAGLSECISAFQTRLGACSERLSLADESSARFLLDAAGDLVHQARAITRR